MLTRFFFPINCIRFRMKFSVANVIRPSGYTTRAFVCGNCGLMDNKYNNVQRK